MGFQLGLIYDGLQWLVLTIQKNVSIDLRPYYTLGAGQPGSTITQADMPRHSLVYIAEQNTIFFQGYTGPFHVAGLRIFPIDAKPVRTDPTFALLDGVNHKVSPGGRVFNWVGGSIQPSGWKPPSPHKGSIGAPPNSYPD